MRIFNVFVYICKLAYNEHVGNKQKQLTFVGAASFLVMGSKKTSLFRESTLATLMAIKAFFLETFLRSTLDAL